MNRMVYLLLVVAIVLTAIKIVSVRQQHRAAFTALQENLVNRDELSNRWRELLIEANTYALPNRVEKDASEALAMRPPKSDEIEYIDLTDDGIETAGVAN